ncbi:AbiH family protein [Allomuricauda sp. M10]|uniref:AbiH family protein n=1 Tax=Allomuricauda sp. M10 TaxID=2683292 RepID=UPI001D19312B|nr:AbiH family protein [Muricauda sp. M10]
MEEGQQKYGYNRIVIVGNGMDLAMGLKSSYSDFLANYLFNCAEQAQQGSYQDMLFKIDWVPKLYPTEANSLSSMQDWNELLKHNTYWNYKYLGFLENVMNNLSIENWVDVESLYFDTMIPMIDNVKKGKLNSRNYQHITTLNDSFRELTRLLDIYIKKIDNVQFFENTAFQYFLEGCFEKQILKEVCLNHPDHIGYDNLPDPRNVMFLNFNYTSTLTKLLNYVGKRNRQTINIHGVAGNIANPIIFGYGDDTHPYYARIEEERSDVPLEFIKSFYYNRTTAYHKMLGFMDSGPYEVYIVGHSCGLSDRTLLKSIFEHKDCISIKIFHRGTIDEHIRKNMAISRHFDDKQLLRKRVLPFDQHAIIPQAI